MKEKPEISVLMGVLNETPEQLERAIRSILEQSFSDFEYIIVLDNPENIAAKKKIAQLQEEDARIVLHTNNHNIGLGATLNVAAGLARGAFLARMDADDVSLPERFAQQIAYMQTNLAVDLLFTWWKEVDEYGNTAERTPPAIYFDQMERYFFTHSLLLHPSMLVRAYVLRKHPYPAITRPEDLVLFLQLIRKHYTFGVVERVLYEYTVDRQNVEVRWRKIQQYSQNMLKRLIHEVRFYWHNLYFWLYFVRIIGEYLASRNFFIFKCTHAHAARLWKRFSKQDTTQA